MNVAEHDVDLLRAFARHGTEPAFTAVVRRHLDLVYGTAVRKLSDATAAEEVTQDVFAALARNAWQFAPDDSVPAWLSTLATAFGKDAGAATFLAVDQFVKKPGLEPGLFGLILVLFILFEPTGIYGRWRKIQLYFSTFPLYKRATFRRQKAYMRSERLR